MFKYSDEVVALAKGGDKAADAAKAADRTAAAARAADAGGQFGRAGNAVDAAAQGGRIADTSQSSLPILNPTFYLPGYCFVEHTPVVLAEGEEAEVAAAAYGVQWVFAGVALSALLAQEKPRSARRRRSRKHEFVFGTPDKLEK